MELEQFSIEHIRGLRNGMIETSADLFDDVGLDVNNDMVLVSAQVRKELYFGI